MSRFVPHRLTVVVVVVGVLVTGVLSGLSRINYMRNEQRLVTAQAQLTGGALTAAPLDVASRLGSAVDVVAATQDVAAFRTAIGPSVTTGTPYVAVLLFQQTGSGPELRASIGKATFLSPTSGQTSTLVAAAVKAGSLQVIRVTQGTDQRLGYALSGKGAKGTYVAYAEQVLPPNRRLALPAGSPLRGSDFAIYLGRTTDRAALLATNASTLPLGGIRATTTVPFGNNFLTLSLSPRGSLLGGFAQSVAFAIAIGGVLFTVFAASLTESLLRRRRVAEELAEVTGQLYLAQRNVAETLQHALLPKSLPQCAELEIAVRYLPGTAGIEVGGDWYDVVLLDDDHAFFTIGDVSGRGLDAAILMGSLRTAVNAYALEGHDPGDILTKVGRMVDIPRDGRFATVLCGRIGLRTGIATLANAGHPGPLLVDNTGSHLLTTEVGPPIGLDHAYGAVEVRMLPGSTLVAYTDGLVERRGETLGAGLDRLRSVVRSAPAVEEMLDSALAAMLPGSPSDDIAVLGLRWRGHNGGVRVAPASTAGAVDNAR